MRRQKDFIEAGIQYRFEQGKPMAIGGGNFSEMTREMNRTKPFEAGAEHGYQYAVDKTCEFFDSISCCEWVEDIEVKELVKKYKKFMNEQL